jgi:3D (Asp-Asp-Asp) domain-containing protein
LKKALLLVVMAPVLLQSTEAASPVRRMSESDASLPLAADRWPDLGSRIGKAAPPVDPSRSGPEETDFVAHFPPPNLEGRTKLELWATHYSIPRARAIADGGHALLDIEGNDLGVSLSEQDWCAAAINGAVEVATPRGGRRIFGFEGQGDEEQVDCSPYFPNHPAIGRSRFRLTRSRFGEGAHRVQLIPFRTIAVDPRVIAKGSVLFIPEARGTLVTLPNGETHVHDGYFYAADTGGAIGGGHIDVFLGFSANNPFSFVKSKPDASFEAYVVEDGWVEDALASAHWSPSPRSGSLPTPRT